MRIIAGEAIPEAIPHAPSAAHSTRYPASLRLSATALACSADDAAFFVDLVHRFQDRGELFWVELRLNGQAVAMSCSFVVATALFGFKVAHDPEFAAYSPGVLVAVQEIEAFLQSPELLVGDSGSSAESFIRSYWRGRARVAQILVPLSHKGRLALSGFRAARWVKHGVSVPTMNGLRSRRAS